jgi:hypothetical protein
MTLCCKSLWLLLPCFLAMWTGLGSARTPDGKADFDAVLQQVQRSIEGRRFQSAKELLLAKLGEHKDKDYVRAKLDEIRADLKTCSFNLKHPRKQIGDLLTGQIVSYDAKTGQISLAWRKDAKGKDGKPVKFPGDDFETVQGDRTLKLPFEGPFTLQLAGKALGQTAPKVRLCIREDQSYEVILDAGDASRVYLLSQGERVLAAETTTNVMNVARPYVLKYVVREWQIEASFNGTRLIQCPKEKDAFGQLAFRDVADLERIEVTGKAKTAWIEARIDEIAKKELAEFEKTYDGKADLPAWLQ